LTLVPLEICQPSFVEQSTLLLRRNAKRFRGGLVFKAHRLLYHATRGLRVKKKKKKNQLSIVDRGDTSYACLNHIWRSTQPGRLLTRQIPDKARLNRGSGKHLPSAPDASWRSTHCACSVSLSLSLARARALSLSLPLSLSLYIYISVSLSLCLSLSSRHCTATPGRRKPTSRVCLTPPGGRHTAPVFAFMVSVFCFRVSDFEFWVQM